MKTIYRVTCFWENVGKADEGQYTKDFKTLAAAKHYIKKEFESAKEEIEAGGGYYDSFENEISIAESGLSYRQHGLMEVKMFIDIEKVAGAPFKLPSVVPESVRKANSNSEDARIRSLNYNGLTVKNFKVEVHDWSGGSCCDFYIKHGKKWFEIVSDFNVEKPQAWFPTDENGENVSLDFVPRDFELLGGECDVKFYHKGTKEEVSERLKKCGFENIEVS